MTNAPARSLSGDVPGYRRDLPAALTTFRVQAPRMREFEELFEDVFRAMHEEEVPLGGVKLFTLLRDPADPGLYHLLEYFTEAGAKAHARGPSFAAAAARLEPYLLTAVRRVMLAPSLEVGCGARVTGQEEPSDWRAPGWWASY